MPLSAQQGDSLLADKKVALVLSGGSAHGLAHIGVIRYLEEIGLKPDYITGTSMGAVVGGLYALGYNADQIERIAADQDWDLIMSNKIPLDEIAPVEKSNHERIPLSLYWKNDKFKLPAGIIRGQRLDIKLSRLFAGAHGISDFDELPIPFRCVAIDLEDGSIDVFNSGFIGDAIRASMAIPSVFPPKELNGRIYVDGGLIRNFPVSEAHDLGADIVIGVYVGGVKMNRDNLNSIFDILEQSAFMGGMLDSDLQSKNLDILISPRVKKMGKFDFDNYKTFVDRGYQAAMSQEAELKALAEARRYKATVLSTVLTKTDSIVIDNIEIGNSNPTVRKLISQKIKKIEGERIAVQDLESSLALIYGTKNFSKTSYTFTRVDTSLSLKLIADNAEPYNIGISLNRFERYGSALILNAEARNVFGRLSNLRLDTRISEKSGIQLQYYQRIAAAPKYLFRVYGKLENFELPFINSDVLDRLYNYRDINLSAEILKEWRNNSMFGLGYRFKFDRLKPEIFKANDLKKYSTSRSMVYLSYGYNNADKQSFATRGTVINTEVAHVFGLNTVRQVQTENSDFLPFTEPQNYWRADFNGEQYFGLTHQLVIELKSSGRLSTANSFLDHYRMGGPMQFKAYTFGFMGLEESELIVGDHIALRAGLRFLLSDWLYISPTVQYLYGEDYLANAFERDDRVSVLGLGFAFGIDSPIGPVYLDLGYTNFTGELNVNLGIGFRHIY